MMLKIIRGGPTTLSCGQAKKFARRLIGTDSAGRTLLNVRTREKLKVKMRVELRTV